MRKAHTAALLLSLFLVSALLMVVASWITTAPALTVSEPTAEELDWYQANSTCHLAGPEYRLPTISELLRLYHGGHAVQWRAATDYWSSSQWSGYVFGLNSRLGITSFDSPHDKDHLICVAAAAHQ